MNTPPKIVFFGTPQIAAEMLEYLQESDIFEIAAVVTNPDAPAHRGQQIIPSPVKQSAVEKNIPVHTPEIMDSNFLKTLEDIDADMFAVVAYGTLLPKKLLDMPRLGIYNLHFSLLPKYRGASPVQSALLDGEKKSGLSLFRLVPRMDAGDIYVQEEVDIANKNALEVFTEMTNLGKTMLRKFCEDMLTGKQFSPQPQNENEATYCGKFQKTDGQIFPERETAEQIMRKYHAFFLWPQIFYIDPQTGIRIKFLELRNTSTAITGQDICQKQDTMCFLKTASGSLEIITAQPAGKSAMAGIDFYNWWQQR